MNTSWETIPCELNKRNTHTQTTDKYTESRKDARFVGFIFIIFDLEVAFLFPWAVAFGDLSMVGFWSMMVFLAVLTIGFAYEWKKGALEWE